MEDAEFSNNRELPGVSRRSRMDKCEDAVFLQLIEAHSPVKSIKLHAEPVPQFELYGRPNRITACP